MSELQRCYLKPISPPSPPNNRGVPCSPTDEMLSPISRALNQNRKKIPSFRMLDSLYTIESISIIPSPCEDVQIVLGSSSQSRRNILTHNKWEFDVLSPDIDEKSILGDPYELPLKIAKAKAEALMKRLAESNQYDRCVLITSDSVVLFEGVVREKPRNREEAIEFLSSYSGKSVQTLSAVVVTEFPSGVQKSGTDIGVLHFDEITDDVVERVAEKGQIYNAAGGILIEDYDLGPLIHSIESTVDSIMGLPLELTRDLILAVLGSV